LKSLILDPNKSILKLSAVRKVLETVRFKHSGVLKP